MNGKMAKMLRNIGRATHADKRQLNALDHKAKGILRKNVDSFLREKQQAELPSHEGDNVLMSDDPEAVEVV